MTLVISLRCLPWRKTGSRSEMIIFFLFLGGWRGLDAGVRCHMVAVWRFSECVFSALRKSRALRQQQQQQQLRVVAFFFFLPPRSHGARRGPLTGENTHTYTHRKRESGWGRGRERIQTELYAPMALMEQMRKKILYTKTPLPSTPRTDTSLCAHLRLIWSVFNHHAAAGARCLWKSWSNQTIYNLHRLHLSLWNFDFPSDLTLEFET